MVIKFRQGGKQSHMRNENSSVILSENLVVWRMESHDCTENENLIVWNAYSPCMLLWHQYNTT